MYALGQARALAPPAPSPRFTPFHGACIIRNVCPLAQQPRWRSAASTLEHGRRQGHKQGLGLRRPSTASRATDGTRDGSSSNENGASTSASGGSTPSAGVVPQPTQPQPSSDSPAAAGQTAAGSSSNGDASAGSLQPGAAAAAKPAQGGMPHRWRVVAMIAVAFVLCNMDKVNMSVAVIPMAHELGWSGLERGLVSSSFFWGYTLTQIPGGYISTKIGGAKVLAAGVALWSLGTLIAPPAAQNSLLALCASRVIVGLGEGVAPSAATSVLAKTMPPNERSRAVATVWGGLDVGSAVGLLLCGPLIKAFGWPSVFYLFAVLGLIWCRVWPMFKPEEVEPIVTESMSIMDSIDLPSEIKPPEKVTLPWGEFFRSLPVWAVTVAHFCFNWGYYTLLAWLPSYFELALGLEVDKSSFLTLIPYLAMTAMMPLVGPMADGLVEKGMKLTTVRKICQNIAFLGPAACMVACGVLTPAPGSTAAAPMPLLVLLLSMAFALGAWSRGGLYCNHQDLSPKYAGALLGITNTAGALPGVLGVAAAGYLLDVTNSWALAVFYPTALCQLLGAVFYTMFASSERQSWS